MSLQFDGHVIVGGSPETRVSPNFKLKELTRANGTVRVHRETVSALQILRDRFDESISVVAMRAAGELGAGKDGLFAWLGATDTGRLEATARSLVREGVLAKVTSGELGLYAGIPNPGALKPISADAALATAIRVTSGFETAADPFQQVTGNFDGAGLSFGPSQVNFGTGTLAPLFQKFKQIDEAAISRCFGDGADYQEWLGVLRMSNRNAVQWADERSTGRGDRDFVQPWKRYLRAVGRVPAFRQAMTDFAKDKYGDKLSTALAWLKRESGMQVDSLRAVCAVYDLCTQQGSLNKAHARIRSRIRQEQPADDVALVHIAAEERGSTALSQWRTDCISRRLGILYRKPMPGVLAGHSTKTRTNRYFYLLRDVRVSDAQNLIRSGSSRPGTSAAAGRS